VGKFIIPLGIITYVFALLAVITGFMIFKLHIRWVKAKWHMSFAIAALVAGLFHIGIVIFINL